MQGAQHNSDEIISSPLMQQPAPNTHDCQNSFGAHDRPQVSPELQREDVPRNTAAGETVMDNNVKQVVISDSPCLDLFRDFMLLRYNPPPGVLKEYMAWTGIRQAEVAACSLIYSRIDFDNGRIETMALESLRGDAGSKPAGGWSVQIILVFHLERVAYIVRAVFGFVLRTKRAASCSTKVL